MIGTDPLVAFALGVLGTLVAGYLWLRFRWGPSRSAERSPPAGSLIDPPVDEREVGDGPPREDPVRRPGASLLLLSERVILHLDRFGRSSAAEIAPFALCQQGMVEGLSVRQSALTKVLQRLAAAGAIVESTEHVQGQSRRRKVYRLTMLGNLLAKDLRRRAPRASVVAIAR